jgi:glutamate racemase
MARRLLDLDCKLIVVACNTASAAALDDLRQVFPVPFVGMVPGVKPAALQSKSHYVAVLATPGTLGGDLYADVRERFGAATRVEEVPGAGLAELVERGEAGTPAARAALRRALGDAIARGADTVVLGCTHYAFLAADIAAEFPGVDVIDTAEPVARRTVAVLDEFDLRAPGRPGTLDLVVSGDRAEFRARMAALGFAARPMEVVG